MDYDKITVADILLRADVSRGTFYSHYADKDALFVDTTGHLLDELVDELGAVVAQGTATLTGAGVCAMFRHARKHREVYLAVLAGAAGGVPMQQYSDKLTATIQAVAATSLTAVGATPRMPVDAIARCWVGEQLTLTSWWLEADRGIDVNQLTRMRMHLMIGGATWAYGLSPGELRFDDQLD
jgi:AcrR family transcriptional regulator